MKRPTGRAKESLRQPTSWDARSAGKALDLLQHETFVRAKGLGKSPPAIGALEIEDAEVERDELRVVCSHESVHGAGELVGRKFLREVAFHLAFAIVRDLHAIAECLEDLLLAFHEVDLEEVLAYRVAGAELEGLVKPDILVSGLFLLNEDGAELPVRSETAEGGVVESFFVLTDPLAHVGDESGLNFLINLVGVHSCFKLWEVNTPHR